MFRFYGISNKKTIEKNKTVLFSSEIEYSKKLKRNNFNKSSSLNGFFFKKKKGLPKLAN